MTSDRRSPRKTAERVIPLQIEPDISAIVLDSSEAGFRFKALRPVMLTGSIRFSFTDNGHPFEASGELVWIDSTRQTGGLSLASLPEVTRQRIRNWILSPTLSDSRPIAPSLPGSGQPSAPYSSPPGLSLPQDIGQGFVMLEDDQRYFGNRRTGFFPGFLTGAIVSAIVAVTMLFAFGSSVGALLAQWRAADNAAPVSQAAIPVPPSAPVLPDSNTAGLSAAPQLPPLPAPDSQDTGQAAPPAAQQLSPAQAPPAIERPSQPPDDSAPAPADTGAAELALAQRYLDDRRGSPNSAAAARLLWSAVEKGNLTAEITLAGLYARGDGVTKNCDQARILLRAAAERGSSEASQQLAQVVRTGCR